MPAKRIDHQGDQAGDCGNAQILQTGIRVMLTSPEPVAQERSDREGRQNQPADERSRVEITPHRQ